MSHNYKIRRLTNRNNICVQVKSQNFWSKPKPKEITDDATAKEAVAIRKLVTSRTEVRALGWTIARSTAASSRNSSTLKKMYSRQLKRRWRTSAKRFLAQEERGDWQEGSTARVEYLRQVRYQRQITTQPESLRRASAE